MYTHDNLEMTQLEPSCILLTKDGAISKTSKQILMKFVTEGSTPKVINEFNFGLYHSNIIVLYTEV